MLFSHGQPTFIRVMRSALGLHQCQQVAGLSQSPRADCKHEAAESPKIDRHPPHHL